MGYPPLSLLFVVVQAQENWLDVFKVTKETLLKDIETANNRYARKKQQAQQPHPPAPSASDTAPVAGAEAGDQQQHPQSDEPKPEDHGADVKIFPASWICLLF